MLPNFDSRKKAGVESFINEHDTLDKVLYKQDIVGTNLKRNAKKNKKYSCDKEKKPSIWSWKSLKTLISTRNRRFSCCFSLVVHSIEGLPPFFDDACLVVHWKSRDIEQKTCPVRVNEGLVEFEEHLIHSTSVNVSRCGSHELAKYEAKQFLLYVSVYNSPELDLGKHHVELSRLFPLAFEELEEEKSSGKWSTNFRLSGKAKGATLNVSFGYVAMPASCNSNFPEILSLRRDRTKTETFVDQFDHVDVANCPNRLFKLSPCEDLHEILPIQTSELCESESVRHQKPETPSATVENQLDIDPSGEFSVVEKEIEQFIEEHMGSEEDFPNVLLTSGEALEADFNGILDEDDAICDSAEEIDDPLIRYCNSTEVRNEILSKELLMKELETELSHFINGLVDSQEEDERHVLHQEDAIDIYSDFGESLGIDEVTNTVASNFLTMLGIEHSPFGLRSEIELDSPRELLLKQFENELAEIPTEETISEHFHHASIHDVLGEMPETDASNLEDLMPLELKEKSFHLHFPLNDSSAFGSSVESIEQLQDPFVDIENGTSLCSTSPALFKNAVVKPSEMGCGVIEKLSTQPNKPMPSADITEKNVQQIAPERPHSHRQGNESGNMMLGLIQVEPTRNERKIHGEVIREEDMKKSGKNKLWGSTNQHHSSSRWLIANGMGKKKKHPLLKSKIVDR